MIFLFVVLGFVVSVLCTPCVIRLSRTGLGLDYAHEPRKRHGPPVSRLGGMPLMLAMSLGLAFILIFRGDSSAQWLAMLLGSVMMYGLGLWDDLWPLGAKAKLLGQIAAACIVFSLGLNIEKFSYPGATAAIGLGAWSLPVTVLWLIAIPNIVNLIDGFDGLAGGLGLCLAVTLGIVGLHSDQVAVACYAFTMAGALFGFLVFNLPPARIYLGDGGAYLIGFTIAALSLTSSNKGSVAAVLFVTVVALGVPILDTTFALARRGLRGYPLFRADDEHFHHRLEGLGISKRRILLGLYGVCAMCSLAGLSIIWSQGRTLPIGICLLFVLVFFVVRYLHLVTTWAEFRQKFERMLGHRREVRYALLQAKVLDLELQRCANSDEFWPLFHGAMRRLGFVEQKPVAEDFMLEIQTHGTGTLILQAPQGGMGSRGEWSRMAECFRPIHAKAVRKWPI